MKRSRLVTAIAAALLLTTTACGSGFDDDQGGTAQQSAGPADLKILIASSGDAETKAVTDATASPRCTTGPATAMS